MKRPTDVPALLEQWRQAPDLETPSALDHGAQIRAISGVLGRVAERRAVRQRQRKQWAFAAVAAGVIGVAVAGWQLVRGDSGGAERAGVSVERAGAGVALLARDGAPLAARRALFDGEGVETHAGEAELGFPSGARVQIAEQSSIRVVHAREDEAFFLSSGKVEVEVPKLGAGQFSVRTPDARVVVHGTHFSVGVESRAGQPRTRVDVSRGLVSVETRTGEVWLSAGQHWPVEEASTATAEPPHTPSLDDAPPVLARELPAAPALERTPVKAQRAHAARGLRRAPATPAALAEQNRRFARAMELKKQELFADALREFDGLERAFPRSVFGQELVVERFRLLEHLGRHREAARVARSYLGDFPNGYAVSEAREIALGVE